MTQTPRWYRKQYYEHKLNDVLRSPYSDISQVQAARKAVDEKLAQDNRDYARSQNNLTLGYLKRLR